MKSLVKRRIKVAGGSMLLAVTLLAGCRLQNDDPKAMAQWKARYEANDASSQLLNSMPRDDLDRVVELKAIPQRVAVLGPGAMEMVYALGQEKKLIGRDSASDYPAQARKLQVVGDFGGPNIERLLAANPDFVILQGETWGRDRVEAWQKQIGVPVACIGATNMTALATDMQKVGTWLGVKNLSGLKTLQQLKEIAATSAAASSTQSNRNTAIFEIQREPLMAAGTQTLVGDVMLAAGLKNAAGVKGYQPVNMEVLLAKPPRFYVVSSSAVKTKDDLRTKLAQERARVLADLRRENSVKNLEAVRAGRVLVVPADWALRPGPRVVDAIETLREQALSF